MLNNLNVTNDTHYLSSYSESQDFYSSEYQDFVLLGYDAV